MNEKRDIIATIDELDRVKRELRQEIDFNLASLARVESDALDRQNARRAITSKQDTLRSVTDCLVYCWELV